MVLVICVLQGCAGVYYAFFACYFLLMSGLMSALIRRTFDPLKAAVLFVAVTSCTMCANLAPHIIYQMENGRNPEIAQRGPAEAELHGLKIAQLYLPVPNHRFKPLANVTSKYYSHHRVLENSSSTLGLVGAIGFTALLVMLIIGASRDRTMMGLCKLNVLAVLLGTIGGFSSLFSHLISPMIRGYNRISIFIAFFSLFAICLLFERLKKYLDERRYPGWAFPAIASVVLVIGLLDEVPANVSLSLTDDPYAAERWENDVEFFGTIESKMPEGALIFQYPPFTLPEGEWPAGVEMLDESGAYSHMPYDHIRGYLHTNSLRWSLPMRGRRADDIVRNMSERSIREQLEMLAYGGFTGIYIFRRGYADRGLDLETELTQILGTAPLVSSNSTMSFFDMTEYVRDLKSQLSSEEWRGRSEAIWNSPQVKWGTGFHGPESLNSEPFRWCSSRGVILVFNYSEEKRAARLEFVCHAPRPGDGILKLESELLSRSPREVVFGEPVSEDIVIPPGVHEIHFSTDAQALDAPNDPRSLVFQVRGFSLKMMPRK